MSRSDSTCGRLVSTCCRLRLAAHTAKFQQPSTLRPDPRNQADRVSLAILLDIQWGLFWVDSVFSLAWTVMVLSFGLAFSHASSRPFSKSSLLTRPTKGSFMPLNMGWFSNIFCCLMAFFDIGFCCHAKSSEKTYSVNAANPMPGTIRVVSGTKIACHFRESPYFASPT